MKKIHKTSLMVAVGVITILAIAFFLVTNVFVNSATDVYVPPSQENTVVIQSDAYYYVSVADTLVHENFDTALSAEAALAHCETIAYNPDNMWKQVICVHAGTTIYQGIFVAG